MRGIEIILLLVVLATAVAASAAGSGTGASLLVSPGCCRLRSGSDGSDSADVVSLVVLRLLYAAGQDCPGRSSAVWARSRCSRSGWLSLRARWAWWLQPSRVAASMAFVLGAVLASTEPGRGHALGRRWRCPPA